MNKKSIAEAPIFNLINIIANIVLLNMLFLLCSLPIVTIGISYTSMYSVARNITKKDTLIFKSFFTAFKENFKQSTLAWLIVLIPIFVMLIEFNLLTQVSIEVPLIVYVCLAIPCLFLLIYLPYLLMEPVYFVVNLKQQFKNAFLLMIRLIPQSVMILILNIFPFLCFIFALKTFLLAWPMWLFIYFASSTSLVAMSLKLPMQQLKEDLIEK